MVSIDATVVDIALPAIGRDFGASLAGLQWVVTAYTLTLAGLLLFAGALGDRYGRKLIFLTGVVWFALASLICGQAPDTAVLIGARAVQGIGAALLTPGSLAIIEASFRPGDRGRAIGAWSDRGGRSARGRPPGRSGLSSSRAVLGRLRPGIFHLGRPVPDRRRACRRYHP
jgi:MFS family permease